MLAARADIVRESHMTRSRFHRGTLGMVVVAVAAFSASFSGCSSDDDGDSGGTGGSGGTTASGGTSGSGGAQDSGTDGSGASGGSAGAGGGCPFGGGGACNLAGSGGK